MPFPGHGGWEDFLSLHLSSFICGLEDARTIGSLVEGVVPRRRRLRTQMLPIVQEHLHLADTRASMKPVQPGSLFLTAAAIT